jgi:hypothetical protein
MRDGTRRASLLAIVTGVLSNIPVNSTVYTHNPGGIVSNQCGRRSPEVRRAPDDIPAGRHIVGDFMKGFSRIFGSDCSS